MRHIDPKNVAKGIYGTWQGYCVAAGVVVVGDIRGFEVGQQDGDATISHWDNGRLQA